MVSFYQSKTHIYALYSSGQKKVAVPFPFYNRRTVDRALIVHATNDPLTIVQLAHRSMKTIELPFCACIANLVLPFCTCKKNQSASNDPERNEAVLEKEEGPENVEEQCQREKGYLRMTLRTVLKDQKQNGESAEEADCFVR